MSNDNINLDLPNHGGDGRHIGYDERGREVRSFRAGDSIYEFHADRDGFEKFWREAEYPYGKYLRAAAVGPQDRWEERALDSAAGGGDLVPDPIRLRTLDRLTAQSVLGRAGANFVNMDSASLAITRVDNPASHGWTAEASTVSGSTDPNFASETLQAKTLRAIHTASRELVQDAPDFPRVLETELVNAMDEELQRVAFVGSTGNGEPKGLYNSTDLGVTKLDFGGSTGGTVPASSGSAYDELVRARETLFGNNVPEDRQSYIWSPRVNRQFGSLKDGNHQPLEAPEDVNEMREFVTSSVPSTLAPGSLTNQSAVFMGRYPYLTVGMRIDPSVEVLRERSAGTFELDFLSFLRADIRPSRPDGFVILDRIST